MHHHFHRSPSPREIDDLPEAFHCGSPSTLNASIPLPRMDLAWSSLLASSSTSPATSTPAVAASLKRSRDELEQGASSSTAVGHDKTAPSSNSKDKGKGKMKQEESSIVDEECSMDHDHGANSFEEMGLPISLANASIPHYNTHRRPPPHHPQNEEHTLNGGALPFNGFGVKGTPGGDCKRICVRHQRMVDAGARLDLQKVGG